MNTTATPTAVVALSAQPFPGGQGDAVRALPAEWRARAEELSVHDAIGLTHQLKLKDCADELEAALASMPSSSAMGVTEAMVHAFEDAYCKNWEAQRHAPEGTKELGTFFATRAGLESALAARQPVAGLSWAEYWMERGQPDVAHDFDAFSRAEAWAFQRFPAARQPVGAITDIEIDARLNALYREMVDSGQHNGGMSGVAWDRAVYRMASSKPAQAVDLGQFLPAVRMLVVSARTSGGTAGRDAHLCEALDRVEALLPKVDGQAVGRSFQAAVAEWMGQCFLPSLYSNMTERGDRLLEEVLELLQAHGYDKARIPTLVDYVFGRPVGDPAQEVGGVMVTLAGYCWVAGLDMHADGQAELDRINQPDVMARIRAKQEAKNALHFDTPPPGNAGAAVEEWPREGDLVRYGKGSSALAIRLGPHAGGWHGYQCCGGYTFFTKAHRPSRADMDTWLDCAKYRDERTKVADNRVAHEMYLLDNQAARNG